MKIQHLSVSRSQTWGECEQKYKYKYHMQLPSMIEEPPYFTYGKIVHKIIEVYTEEKGKRNIGLIKDEVLSGKILLENEEPNIEKTLPDSYMKRFDPELKSFLKLTDKIGFEGKAEWGFLFDLDPPNKKNLKGIIDRLIIKNDKFIIIDYKTTQKRSKWRKTPKTVTSDLQLQCYARVVMEYFKVDPKNIRAALYYLAGGDLIGATFSKKTLMQVEDKLLRIYKDIENRNPDTVKGTVGDHCKRCDYAKICPFFNPLQRIYGKNIH